MVRHYHRIVCTLILTLAINAAAAGGAAARAVDYPLAANNHLPPTPSASTLRAINRSELNRQPAFTYSVPADFAASIAATRPNGLTAPRITTPGNGFSWGDAGIGAAGALALVLCGVGVALAVSQRRARCARDTRPVTG